jgi:hypothetical protein
MRRRELCVSKNNLQFIVQYGVESPLLSADCEGSTVNKYARKSRQSRAQIDSKKAFAEWTTSMQEIQIAENFILNSEFCSVEAT